MGSLLPLWLTIFLRRAYDLPNNFEDFVLRGDLVLIAAAFLAPAIYQVGVRMRKEASFLGIGAIILAVVGLLFSALVYVVLNPEVAASRQGLPTPDYKFVSVVSWVLFLFAFTLAVCIFLNEQQLEFENLQAAEKIDQTVLSSQLEELKPEAVNAQPLETQPDATDAEMQDALKDKFKEDADG